MRIALGVIALLMCVTSETATAQSIKAFEQWGIDNGSPVLQCPRNAYPSGTPQSTIGANPFFEFNGTPAHKPHLFSCEQRGPFKFGGQEWWVQNVKNLHPTTCSLPLSGKAVAFCVTDAVRICSLKASPGGVGPFNGQIGAHLCEGLWHEDFYRPGVL
jgi:hypothetical protein